MTPRAKSRKKPAKINGFQLLGWTLSQIFTFCVFFLLGAIFLALGAGMFALALHIFKFGLHDLVMGIWCGEMGCS